MEFSVVVKASGKPPAGEAWEELERFLRSARISPAVLHRLTPGKTHILKKRLSYEQALRICDRLTDFGLPSAVNPPTKPETPRTVTGLKPSNTVAQKPPGRSDKRPQSASLPVQQVSPKKPSDEIRNLFTLPASKVKITLPSAHRWRTRLLALRGIGFATVILIGGAVAALACVAAIGVAAGLIASLSPLVATLFVCLTLATLVGTLAILTLPLWRSVSKPALKIEASDQPRLVLLCTAVCRLLDAPIPSVFVLGSEPRVIATYRCKRRSLWRLRESLEGEPVLHIGTPLLARLQVRELAALVARECGRFAQPELRRPYFILSQQRQWSAKHLTFIGLRDRFPILQERVPQGRHVTADRMVAVADKLQSFTCRTLRRYHDYLDGLLNSKDAVARAYQELMIGEKSPALQDKLARITSDLESALEKALSSRDLYLAESLSHLLAPAESGLVEKPAAIGIVRCSKPANSLVDDFPETDRAITRQLYQSLGICLESVQLVTGAELQQRKANAALLDKAAREYFGPWFDHRQFWVLPPENFTSQAEQKIVLSRLNHCISRVRFLSPDRRELLLNFSKLRQQVTELDAAKIIIASGHRYEFRHCPGLAARDLETQSATRHLRLSEIREELGHHNAVMGERLALGLALDSRHRTLTGKLHRALCCLEALGAKASRLETELDKIELLNAYTPRRREQQYQIQLDELQQSIEGLYRLLRRKLQRCPYDFYDRRFATVDALLDARLQQKARREGDLNAETMSRVLLMTVAEAHEYTSKLAAYFAAQMEKAHGAETVRRA
ncbi:hypothetical protein F6455_00435 [Proteobacteria bacterium 005FR1]|nr:hypothetical protein [Proteobacteria bacterium 005FR1]